ncbi:TPA: acyltransferase family protein, partial [Citrobacter farmeri]
MTAVSHPKYRADIDGLRALAVVPVVLFHAFPSMLPGGFVGVDIFFVISGFLISSIIIKSTSEGTFTYKDFYIRRINRIFPTLSLVLATALIFGWFSLYADEYMQL